MLGSTDAPHPPRLNCSSWGTAWRGASRGSWPQLQPPAPGAPIHTTLSHRSHSLVSSAPAAGAVEWSCWAPGLGVSLLPPQQEQAQNCRNRGHKEPGRAPLCPLRDAGGPQGAKQVLENIAIYSFCLSFQKYTFYTISKQLSLNKGEGGQAGHSVGAWPSPASGTGARGVAGGSEGASRARKSSSPVGRTCSVCQVAVAAPYCW